MKYAMVVVAWGFSQLVVAHDVFFPDVGILFTFSRRTFVGEDLWSCSGDEDVRALFDTCDDESTDEEEAISLEQGLAQIKGAIRDQQLGTMVSLMTKFKLLGLLEECHFNKIYYDCLVWSFVEGVELFLKTGPELAKIPFSDGKTPLFIASGRDIPLPQLLSDERREEMASYEKRVLSIVKMLCEHGAESTQDHNKITPIELAQG